MPGLPIRLLPEIGACIQCRDILEPRPILQLSSKSRILIASQAPGRMAHESGIPFMDASGRRLREWLGLSEAAFYDADNIAILPMAFCFPGTGRQGDLPPPPVCAERWREQCLAVLHEVELTLLIGKYAQSWHLGPAFKTVTDAVQSWQHFAPGMLPLPHPSPRNAPWVRRHPWFEAELIPVLQNRVAEILYK